jgi:S1-C subfamily serine protease
MIEVRSLILSLVMYAAACGCSFPKPDPIVVPPISRVDSSLDAVVALTVPDTNRSYCAGVFVGDYVLTAAHCVDDPLQEDGQPKDSVEIRTREGEFGLSDPITMRVADFGPDRDLAVLVATGVLGAHASVPLAPYDVRPGDRVVVVGHPRGLTWTITTGIATGVRVALPDGLRYLQVSAQAAPGNSGGPVYNEFGEVAGIVVAGFQPHLVLATPLEALREALGR